MRTHVASIRFRPSEWRAIKGAARRENKQPSEWARERLLAATTQTNGKEKR